MRKILFILPIILVLFISCNSDQIKNLEERNKALEERNKELFDSLSIYKDKYIQKDSLYDSVLNKYWDLREKMTKHIEYVYTVYDDIIRDEEGKEWDFDEFVTQYCDGSDFVYLHVDDILDYVHKHYDKDEIIEYYGITSDDFNY